MSVWIGICSSDEVPHLDKDAIADLIARTPPYLRDARFKGIPVMGTGLIYPIPEEDIKVAASSIHMEANWPCGFAMDVSFNKTAVGFFTKNPVSQVIYLYDCHYQGREEPAIHAEAIKSRGAMPGVIAPRADNRSADDSKELFKMYTQHYGLDLIRAEASVTTGISEVWQMLQSGMLKVSDAASLEPFWKEFRMYRTKTDKDGNVEVVKKDDHAMDFLRYFVVSGISRMRPRGEIGKVGQSMFVAMLLGADRGRSKGQGLGWM